MVIATPVTLISVLKGIAYGWNQEQLAENAEEIRRVASEMYERVQSVQEHYSATGRLLEKTVAAYNSSVGSWDSRLVPALRKMRELGVSSGARAGSAGADRFAGAASARGERILSRDQRERIHYDMSIMSKVKRSGGRQESGAGLRCAQVSKAVVATLEFR